MGRQGSTADTCPTVTVASASTASTLVAAVTLVASTTTVSSWTNTTLGISERSACATSTRLRTCTTAPPSTYRIWTLVPASVREEHAKAEVTPCTFVVAPVVRGSQGQPV